MGLYPLTDAHDPVTTNAIPLRVASAAGPQVSPGIAGMGIGVSLRMQTHVAGFEIRRLGHSGLPVTTQATGLVPVTPVAVL